MSLLWRLELADIQEKFGMHAYRENSKFFVRNKILERVPMDGLQKSISEELFERDYTKIAEEIESDRKAQKKHR